MTPSSVPIDPVVLLVVADDHPLLAEVISERIDDLVVQEREQLVSRVDEIRLDAEVAEDRRVLAADDAGAVDGDRVGREAELQIVSLSKMRGWEKSMSGGW